MSIEKKYRIAKISIILLSITLCIVLYAIGTHISRYKEEARTASFIRGTYVSGDTFTNVSLDDDDSRYYVLGNIVSSGTYKRLSKHVFKLLSGEFKDAYIIKDSNGDITLIKNGDSAEVYKKFDNQITIMHE